MRRIVGILLAAGSASRFADWIEARAARQGWRDRGFGSNKLLAPLADGTPLAAQAARTLRAVLPETIAVVRSAEDPLTRLLRDEGLRCVVCADAAEGMAASIRCGVSASVDADGWLLALADMPFVQRDTIRAVVAALEQGTELAAPFHAGRRGHPVGFTSRFRESLLGLRGDVGARAIVSGCARELTPVHVDDPGVLHDVDTPADLDPVSQAAG